jgi:hypothetical protein
MHTNPYQAMKKFMLALALLAVLGPVQKLRSQDLEDILGQVTNAMTKAEYEEVYTFDAYMQLEISDLGNQTVIYDGYMTRDGSATAILFEMDGEITTVVLDTKLNSVLILSEADGEKNGVALAVNPEALSEIAEDIGKSLEHGNEKLLKTGKTKELLGYQCDEYLVKEDGSTVRMWVSEKLGKEIESDMLTNQQIFGGAFVHTAGTTGMVLEYHFKDEDSGEDRSMKVNKLDLEAKLKLKTGDYAIMTMGSF